MVIAHMHKLNPGKKILFLVNRVHLVQQQSKVIEDETQLKVMKSYGNKFTAAHFLLQEQLINHDVLVVTVGLYMEMLKVSIQIHPHSYNECYKIVSFDLYLSIPSFLYSY